MIVRPPQTPEEFERYRDLRWRILRAPWNQPKGTEVDELESKAFPIMVCKVDGIPIGVGRVHFNSETEAQIRSMAVEEEWRGKGIGSIVIKELEKIAIEKGAKKIILQARDNAVEFYERNGYKVVKQSHTLFGSIPHFEMSKEIEINNGFFEKNKLLWNKWTSINAKSEFYGLEEFKKGKNSLNFVELAALDDVKNKSLLHLQCHFGMDTLSLARLGAKVTGVDFSDEAIKLAKNLNEELKLNAEFLCSNVYDLKDKLDKKFDVVFTSYGVIGWLPDLDKWANIISHFLKTGGLFFMAEFHPVIWMYDFGIKSLKYSYFNSGKPIEEVAKGNYADRKADIIMTEYGWNHSLDEVFNSLKNNALETESFNEYPFSFYDCFPNMVKGPDNFWRIKGFENILPLMYSIKAFKS